MKMDIEGVNVLCVTDGGVNTYLYESYYIFEEKDDWRVARVLRDYDELCLGTFESLEKAVLAAKKHDKEFVDNSEEPGSAHVDQLVIAGVDVEKVWYDNWPSVEYFYKNFIFFQENCSEKWTVTEENVDMDRTSIHGLGPFDSIEKAVVGALAHTSKSV